MVSNWPISLSACSRFTWNNGRSRYRQAEREPGFLIIARVCRTSRITFTPARQLLVARRVPLMRACMIYWRLNSRGVPNLKVWSKYGVGEVRGVPCEAATSRRVLKNFQRHLRTELRCASFSPHLVHAAVWKNRHVKGETAVNREEARSVLATRLFRCTCSLGARIQASQLRSRDEVYDGSASC